MPFGVGEAPRRLSRRIKKYKFFSPAEIPEVPGHGKGIPSPSGVVAVDEATKLLGHGVDQLLLVPLVLPELGENVVFPAGVPHPARSTNRSGSRDWECSALREEDTEFQGSTPIFGVFFRC